jgi:hypothetical protein
VTFNPFDMLNLAINRFFDIYVLHVLIVVFQLLFAKFPNCVLTKPFFTNCVCVTVRDCERAGTYQC